MLRNIFTNTVEEIRSCNNGWIIGSRMPRDKFAELISTSTSVKFSMHQPGDPVTGERTEPKAGEKATLVVLLSGKIEHVFYDADLQPIEKTVLSEHGQVVYYGPAVPHTWKVLAPDTEVLTLQFYNSADDV